MRSPGAYWMRHSLFNVLVLSLAAGSRCVSYSEHRASAIHFTVAAGEVKAGRSPHLRLGMPIRDAEARLAAIGFRPEQRERTGSTFTAANGSALHFVHVLPHPNALVVFHHEVHVLLLHDGHSLKDVQSETIYTTVD